MELAAIKMGDVLASALQKTVFLCSSTLRSPHRAQREHIYIYIYTYIYTYHFLGFLGFLRFSRILGILGMFSILLCILGDLLVSPNSLELEETVFFSKITHLLSKTSSIPREKMGPVGPCLSAEKNKIFDISGALCIYIFPIGPVWSPACCRSVGHGAGSHQDG